MPKRDDIHPILANSSDQQHNRSLLRNTNVEFPVSVLLEREIPESKDPGKVKTAHVARSKSHTPKTQILERHEQPESEMLTPFTQWLLSLKPSPRTSKTMESPDIRSFPEPPVKLLGESGGSKGDEPKKKKKKKKKKLKDQSKWEQSASEMASFKSDILSDTLAELIAGQGHIDEAIRMYRKLIHLYPDKAPHYIQRIHELRPR